MSIVYAGNSAQPSKLLLGLLAHLVLLLAACKENKAATECYHLKEALNSQALQIDVSRAAALEAAQADLALSTTLQSLPLKNVELVQRRDRLARLYHRYGELGQSVAQQMEADGSIVGQRNIATYDSIADKQHNIFKEIQIQQNNLKIHCSLR